MVSSIWNKQAEYMIEQKEYSDTQYSSIMSKDDKQNWEAKKFSVICPIRLAIFDYHLFNTVD